MKLFIKKLIMFIKDLIFIVTSMVVSMVASVFIFIVLMFAIMITIFSINYISQERISEIVFENQDDLEMIAEDLRSYDMPRVSVNNENITTYMSFDRLPDGRYMSGPKDSVFSTSEELQRFMKKLKIESIKFTLYDELQIVTFEVYDGWAKGFYWVDPDTPTEKACTSQPHDLTPSGDGWEFVDHGDRYYTEKICDHWYFFEVET